MEPAASSRLITDSAGRARARGASPPRAGYVDSLLRGASKAELSDYSGALLRAERATGQLAGALQCLPDPEAVVAMLRRQEAVASGGLEGVQASMLDLLDAESGLVAMGPGRDVAELRALSEQLARPGEGPWCEKLQYVHDHLLRGMGQRNVGLRRDNTWLGVSGATRAEAVHVPPPPQEIPLLLGEWQDFITQPDVLHPLHTLALAYAQFEAIHPYQSANGRVVRWFLQHYLISRKLLSHPALLWSDALRRDAAMAHQARHALRVQNDPRDWTLLFLKTYATAATETASSVRRVVALRERQRATLAAEFGRIAGIANTVLDALIAQPMLTIKDIITLTGQTFPAANELAQRLVRAGILVEVTGQARNRRFRYAAYARIFVSEEMT
jgi:Fic family protein